jgi:serine/threonine protein kinase
MDTRHPLAHAEPLQPIPTTGATAFPVDPVPALDLRPFEAVLPLLAADVETLYGRRCRLSPVWVRERLYSHVLRVGVWHDGDVAPREHLFVKVSKYKVVDGSPNGMRARVEKDFAVTRHVFARMAGGTRYGAVRPIACYPAHLAIVTEEIPGETLLDLVQHTLRWSVNPSAGNALRDVLAAAGRWIQEFQEPAPGTVSVPWIRDYVDHRLRRIADATGARGERLRDRALRHIDRLGRQLPLEPVDSVTVHADLSPSNIMVSSGRVVVLDFAMARPGHPLQDVARLFTQLDLLGLKPQFRQAAIRPLQQALLEGYDSALRADDPAFRLQVLSQRINHLGSLVTKKYGALESAYNRFVVWQHWRWVERETSAQGVGERPGWA